jgi:catechol 2,3-dioxygenase-like lactoylglutathione lyase family enzyme
MASITTEISVEDIERSRAFYEALGFSVDNEGIKDDKGCQWYSLSNGGATLWILRRDVDEFDSPGTRVGVGVHIFVGVDDVDAAYEVAGDQGWAIAKGIEDLWYGLREFKVRDPDGYLVVVNAPLPNEGGAREQVG